jgi:hypothetical protein
MLIYKVWWKRAAGSIAALLAGVGAINLLVDPFDFHGMPRIKGFNADKPEVATHLRLTKAYAVRSLRPRAIIVGSSRAERGLDPNHPGWDGNSEPRYNLAIAAANIYEAMRYLQHANCINPLKQVVIGLDFFMFNAYTQNKPDFSEERLCKTKKDASVTFRAHDKIQTIFSLDAIRSSISTVKGPNRGDEVKFYLPNGQVSWNFGKEKIKKIGYRNAFLETDNIYLYNYKFCLYDNSGESTLRYLAEIIKLARSDNIDLKFFISPVHARMLEAKKLAGLWPQYEQWKRELVACLEADASANPGKEPFSLWDFSGYNSITTEAVPVPGDLHSNMRFYWESSHYKKEVGDLILNRIFGKGLVEKSDFGVVISADNIEQHLRSIRIKQKKYEQNHSDDMAELIKLYNAIKGNQ